VNYSDISGWFFDKVPYRRKSALDWIVPAGIGLGLGVAAGIGLGMVLAPQSGMETRRLLRDQALRMKDKAMDAATRVRGELATGKDKLERSFVHGSDRAFSNDVGKMG